MYHLIRRGQLTARWERPPQMPQLVYDLLVSRGVGSADEAEAFLRPGAEHLLDPYRLRGMDAAVGRIRAAREAGERVCVFGDYDVDGVCATAILISWLRAAGVSCFPYIPDRHTEGYGLNESAVREIAQKADLLVTVDCGISCAGEIALAKELGLSVLVTDHHRPGDILPDCPIVNPLIGDYPPPSLCGAGVAFKLVEALGGREAVLEYVDLAALATVADLVPLTGENRVIVALGLRAINASPRPGVALLVEKAGLQGRRLSAGNIAFQIAPRINASGRLGSAMRAFALLTCENREDGLETAAELEEENARRRAETTQILGQCQDMLKSYDLFAHRVILLWGEGWNSGVIGLAASQLAQTYHYPVVLLSRTEDACVGSCRSIPAVDIFEALSSCSDLFTRFGGHRQAAGLAMKFENVEPLLARLDAYISAHTDSYDFVPEAEYDVECELKDLTLKAVEQMDLLQPTGYGNPSPVFLARAEVETPRRVGREGAHLQVKLRDGDALVQGIAFGMGDMAPSLEGARRGLLFAPSVNEWRSQRSVQCEVRQWLSEDAASVFDRFDGKYSAHQRAFLTQILYNTEPNPQAEEAAEPTSAETAAGWLRASPMGTVIAAATREGVRSLRAFYEDYGLEGTCDLCAGCWPSGPVPMNGLCLLPTGEAFVPCERLVLWDAGPEAYANLPPHRRLYVAQGDGAGWPLALPDVKTLRTVYLAARWLGSKGMRRVTLSDIERDVALTCGIEDDATVQAALAVLSHMGLIILDRAGASLTIPPVKKLNPEDDPLFQRLNRIRQRFSAKE